MNHSKDNMDNTYRYCALAIKALAIYFILSGLYGIASQFYILAICRPKMLAEYPQYVPDIDALYVFKYVLIVILIEWTFVLGVCSFRMLRWSRVFILWQSYIVLLKAIWKNSLLFYGYFRGLTVGHPFYLVSWLLIISSILIPLLFIVFYSHPKVKAAFQSKDQCVRWNDKHPYLLWLIPLVISILNVLLLIQF